MALRAAEGEPVRNGAPNLMERIRDGLSGLDGRANSEVKGIHVPDVTVREMNLDVKSEVLPYLNYLHALPNRGHFVRPSKTLHDLREEVAQHPGYHYLVAIQKEQVIKDEKARMKKRVIGGALIDDSAFGEGDSGLRLFAIDPNKQGRGLGERVYLEALLWAFLTSTHDGRHRIEVDFSVVLNEDAMLRVLSAKDPRILEDDKKFREAVNKLKAERHVSTRMIRIGEKYGAKFLYGKPLEATEVPGFVRPQPTARYEVRLDPFKDAIRKNADALKLVQDRRLTDFLQT